jgi:hypothetical protein
MSPVSGGQQLPCLCIPCIEIAVRHCGHID